MIDGDGYLWTTTKGASVINQPTTSGSGTQKGQDGNGYCKITYIGN